ncbi:glutathione S-transferase family protein [Tahibacter amnicola]|uniref:Glutathione S-transferase family protein n=1 Tax=Tahibacter amnicola TaxID=2976241 RepID=A0ABY6BL97_9GAMM|nr:glutathione S-transferase family protein [Tahibacter amnicola]UXI69160.1 glutathione S-transferase family protein [Tahibacter amnicola]
MTDAMTLYSFAPFDRSARVRWTAHELGLPLDERRLSYGGGDHLADEYRNLNPFCHVPTVQWGDAAMFESVAICQHLAESHAGHDLIPPPGTPARQQYWTWLFHAASDFDRYGVDVFRHGFLAPNPEKRQQAIAAMKPGLQVLDAHLARNSYVLGEAFTLPDVIFGHGTVLLTLAGVIEAYPHLVAYRDRLAQRPAAQAAGLFRLLEERAAMRAAG